MKKTLFILFVLFLFDSAFSYSENLVFDYKYVKIGVVSNDNYHCFENNPNFRFMGKTGSGKDVLDKLLCRDENGLHIDKLWADALKNTILEEEEIAELDASASKNEVLKKDISRQLLKNNYIIDVYEIEERDKLDNRKTYIKWTVSHIDIDDNIIDQVFLNWNDLDTYDKIIVKTTVVASGRFRKSAMFIDENVGLGKKKTLITEIAKKVPQFAIRGTILSKHPTKANVTKSQGVRRNDVFNIYGLKENRNGELSSYRKGVTIATKVEDTQTQLFSIAGKTPSIKDGDIAVLSPKRTKLAMFAIGQFSFGNDPRYGGRIGVDYQMGKLSKHGIAQYLLIDMSYNTHLKEPADIWYCDNNGEKTTIRPRLDAFDVTCGYGVGFHFLNCMEIMPYIKVGLKLAGFADLGGVSKVYYWDGEKTADWAQTSLSNICFPFYLGARFAVNIYYPFQFLLGCDWDFDVGMQKPIREYEDNNPQIFYNHTNNRLNLYAGFRYCF